LLAQAPKPNTEPERRTPNALVRTRTRQQARETETQDKTRTRTSMRMSTGTAQHSTPQHNQTSKQRGNLQLTFAREGKGREGKGKGS
jgi:hypothetical protein